MTARKDSNDRWWGDYQLPVSAWSGWQIGPLHLYAYCAAGEWLFRWRREPDPLTADLRFDSPSQEPEIGDHESARYALAHHSGELQLQPLLADLPVVARPASTLHIPSHQQTVLYVSTVLWLQARHGATRLIEMPVYRPSDTWFGADTIDGEFCYASRTQARTSLESLIHFPHRAITPIIIVNEVEDPLQILQLRVPLPYLALHVSPDGQLWTDSIELTRGADSAEAALELLGTDSLPAGCERLAAPREAAPRHSLVRSFSRLFD